MLDREKGRSKIMSRAEQSRAEQSRAEQSRAEQDKHAFLIAIHTIDFTLQTLLKLLDDSRNDIYIHMDAKTVDFDPNLLKNSVKKSRMYFVPRTRVDWAAFNQTQNEINMLKMACSKQHYCYYHLLSGVDLPLMSPDELHSFFNAHYGEEFIDFEQPDFTRQPRVQYYWFFQKSLRKRVFGIGVNTLPVLAQRILHIRRNKSLSYQFGSDWFSITDDLARYVVGKEKWIQKTFHHTFASCEIFLQTLVFHSEFKNKIKYRENRHDFAARLIDWDRGTPYVWRNEDFDKIISYSGLAFARKFDVTKDKAIIEKIYHYVNER
jgi:hypothetical protein